jgi:hypothetical protein
MKKFIHFAYICLAFVLFQSANDSKTYTSLTVIHPFQAYYIKDNLVDTSIVDNDGNMYVTTWDLGEKKLEDFETSKKICETKIAPHMIFRIDLDISSFSEPQIKPSLFKENGQCFISQGYVLKAKEGFSPEKFRFSVARTHSKSSSYMPVGGYFYIVKKQARYIDVYKHVIQCKTEAQQKNMGVEEIYDDSYSYVSIEPYFNYMKSCLAAVGYIIEGGTK